MQNLWTKVAINIQQFSLINNLEYSLCVFINKMKASLCNLVKKFLLCVCFVLLRLVGLLRRFFILVGLP